MAKIKSKGTALLQSVSSVYVAIAQVKSIDLSGEKSETFNSETLDQSGAYKTKDPTGYVEPPTIKADVWYDPAAASMVSFEGIVAAPVPTNFKVTYADVAPTSKIYNGTGFGIDKKIAPAEGVTASIEIVTSGSPT